MRQNRINLVEAIYKTNPNVEDDVVQSIVAMATAGKYSDITTLHSFEPSLKTLSVWKAQLRKKGVQIPDKRLRNSKR